MTDSAARAASLVSGAAATGTAHVHVPIALRWSDLDAYGHVNNVAFAGILEQARIRALWRSPTLRADGEGGSLASSAGGVASAGAIASVDLDRTSWVGEYPSAVVDGWPGGDTATLVATQVIEYQTPMPYRAGPVDVELWISAIGGASIDVNYRIEGFITAFTVIVLADAVTHRPRRLRPDERAAWLPYLDAKLPFRR